MKGGVAAWEYGCSEATWLEQVEPCLRVAVTDSLEDSDQETSGGCPHLCVALDVEEIQSVGEGLKGHNSNLCVRTHILYYLIADSQSVNCM